MRLSVVRGGGVAGIATRTELSADSLSANDASALRAKVEEAGLAHLADDVPAHPQPDDLLYQLTLEDEAGVHTVHLAESTLPEAIRSLIAWVDSMPAAEHGRA